MKRALLSLLLVAVAGIVPMAASPAAGDVPVSLPAVARASVATTTTTTSSSAPAPLVVLMDISGSMADSVSASNGSGSVVKLAAAKQALQAPIQNQPPGSSVGIWTFPGPSTDSSGCDAGSWLVNVGSGASSTQILRDINGLQADGDTPTGPALEDVVTSLKARGIESANIVVVSDGLFNCGDDPCQVAKTLANSNFTVSIQAVGFDISEDGAADLKCMADATGGNYFQASDGADLQRVITQLSTPTFKLSLSAPSHAINGKTATVKATLTNTSAFDAHSVQLWIGFASGGPDILLPNASPTTIGVGTLPARQSAARSWTFLVNGSDKISQKIQYSVSASSIEAQPAQATGVFTTNGPDEKASDAGPILSDLVKSKQSLVIMGDSYSSGEGTFDYLPGIIGASTTCHRSPNTYLAPMFTAAKVPVDILACSGATSANFLTAQVDSGTGSLLAISQLSQLDALSTTPGAVILTIGGNDIGFKDIVTQCVQPNAPCTDNQAWVTKSLNSVKADSLRKTLTTAYEDVWRILNQPKFVAKRGGSYAPVIVAAYPQVAWDFQNGTCQLNATRNLDANELKFANNLEAALDQTISAAVRDADSDGFGVAYSDATYKAFVPDNTVCASKADRYVNQIIFYPANLDAKSESFHPDASGYTAESEALITWSKSALVPKTSVAAKATAGSTSSLNALLDSITAPPPEKQKANPLGLGPNQSTIVNPGQPVRVVGSATVSTPVDISLHSDPTQISTLASGPNGKVDGYVTIPANVSFGSHQLIIEGWDKNGKPVIDVANITVRPPTPVWVYALGILAGVLLVVAIVLVFVARRRFRRIRLAG